jgi:glutathione S-transferase
LGARRGGPAYEARLLSFRAKKEPAHLRLHPFGLIPTYEEDDLVLFETGAIIFHIAEHHAGLFPDDANCPRRGAARVRTSFRGAMGDQRRSPASWVTQF